MLLGVASDITATGQGFRPSSRSLSASISWPTSRRCGWRLIPAAAERLGLDPGPTDADIDNLPGTNAAGALGLEVAA